MKLYTERLMLVPLGPEYLNSTHSYAGDIENAKMMVYLPNKDLEETKSFLEQVQQEWRKQSPEFYEFAILLGNEHIGAISLYLEKNNTEGELGWILNKKYWGNGYAEEAAREIVRFAIQTLNIKTLIAHCDSENKSSFRLMEKLGMSLVSKTRGRKNRSSDEDREELLYRLEV